MSYTYLTRRELIKILQALSAVPIVTSCKKLTSDNSPKDLSQKTSKTAVSSERVEYAVQKFGMSSWVQSGQEQQNVFQHLAAVPDVYLEFLQQRAKDVNFRIEFGGGAAGMCYFDSVGAKRITLNHVDFATIHEVGHGVETRAHKLQNLGSGASERERTYHKVVNSSEASYIRSYAKTNSKELFADGFSSFYRSPESRADMAKMPVTFQWLKSVLVCPVNLGPNENPSDYIASHSEFATKSSDSSAASNSSSVPSGENSSDQNNSTSGGNVFVPDSSSSGGSINGTNPCATPTNVLTALICQLSQQIGSSNQGSNGGFGLSDMSHEFILPHQNQILTAHDQFLLMARLKLTAQEAKNVQVYLDKTLIKTGLEKDPYAGNADIYSTMFQVPTQMTPEQDLIYNTMDLNLVLNGQVILKNRIRASRYSLCGDISDFKLSL